MKRQTFTLVEILVVIGIIVILAGMLMAGLGGISGKAEATKCKSQIKDLQNAIAQFQLEYNRLPKPNERNNPYDGTVLTKKQYEWLIDVLSGKDTPRNNEYGNPNTRKKQFLNAMTDKDGNDSYFDPWENTFCVVFEKEYKKGIDIARASGLVPQKDTDTHFKYDVLIWSKGLDGEDKPGKEEKDKKDKSNQDNIYSVETMWDSQTGHNIQR